MSQNKDPRYKLLKEAGVEDMKFSKLFIIMIWDFFCPKKWDKFFNLCKSGNCANAAFTKTLKK